MQALRDDLAEAKRLSQMSGTEASKRIQELQLGLHQAQREKADVEE